jgi:mono/diheme cytochrome c family protein
LNLLKRIVLIVAGAVVVLIPIAITFTIGWRPILGPRSRPVTDRKFEATPERVQRGDYLVNAVAGCFFCHSEPDKTLPDLPPKAGREGAGQFAGTDPALGDVTMPNITPDKETGIGNWTDDEIARAIREGINRDGQMLFPIMPYDNFRHMSDEDIASVVAYLRSIPPVRNSVQRMRPPFPLNRLVMSAPEPVNEPVPNPDFSDPMARGTYLVTLASCGHCHTPTDSMGQRKKGLEFAGGSPMEGEEGVTRASLNITPDTTGLSYFDEKIFLTIIRNGKYGARTLKPPMPWTLYRNMTDDDLRGVWTYVHNLKPVSHHVDNSMEPTMCPVCGNVHGAGSTNRKK